MIVGTRIVIIIEEEAVPASVQQIQTEGEKPAQTRTRSVTQHWI
jgi:hypothetical protein